MVAIYSIGKSVENKQLWVTRISNEVAFSRKGNQQKRKQLKPMVKIVANMHGNEVLNDFSLKIQKLKFSRKNDGQLILAAIFCTDQGFVQF